MTHEMMDLGALVKKAPNADILRDTMAFGAARLMGDGGRDQGRRRPWRALARPTSVTQRLSRPGPGNARRDGRAAHPEAAQGLVLSEVSGAAPVTEKATNRSDLGGLQGVSTRSVDDLVLAMGGTEVSKSRASRLREEIDARVKAFLDCPALRQHRRSPKPKH